MNSEIGDIPIRLPSGGERWVGGGCWRGLLHVSLGKGLSYPYLLIYKMGQGGENIEFGFKTKLFRTEAECQQFMDSLDLDEAFKEGDK